jgi:HSF-type DNA-binding
MLFMPNHGGWTMPMESGSSCPEKKISGVSRAVAEGDSHGIGNSRSRKSAAFHREYRDRSLFLPDGNRAKKDQPTLFPALLFRVLKLIQDDGFDDVISWQPHGRCFIIHNPAELENLLPRYFTTITKYKSLLRQLYNYGFRRLTSSRDKGGYYHEFFLRDRPHLVRYVERVRGVHSGVRTIGSGPEPDFYLLPFVGPLNHEGTAQHAVGLNNPSLSNSMVDSGPSGHRDPNAGYVLQETCTEKNPTFQFSALEDAALMDSNSSLNSCFVMDSVTEDKETYSSIESSLAKELPLNLFWKALEERCGPLVATRATLEPTPLPHSTDTRIADHPDFVRIGPQAFYYTGPP